MAEIDAVEFAEWKAYWQINPFGEERADLRMGINTACLLNVHVPKGKRRYKPSDFMPKFERKEIKQQTPQDMLILMTRITQSLGGKFVKPGGK